jgi:hypothetical protein
MIDSGGKLEYCMQSPSSIREQNAIASDKAGYRALTLLGIVGCVELTALPVFWLIFRESLSYSKLQAERDAIVSDFAPLELIQDEPESGPCGLLPGSQTVLNERIRLGLNP